MLSSVVALGRTRWWSHHRSEDVLGGYPAGGGKSAFEIPIRIRHINLILTVMLGLVVVEAQASPTLPTVAGKSDQQITVPQQVSCATSRSAFLLDLPLATPLKRVLLTSSRSLFFSTGSARTAQKR